MWRCETTTPNLEFIETPFYVRRLCMYYAHHLGLKWQFSPITPQNEHDDNIAIIRMFLNPPVSDGTNYGRFWVTFGESFGNICFDTH
jgi:hypothetical protein